MTRLACLGAAGLALALGGSALAADLPLKSSFAERFSWSGCYLGGHVGGAFVSNSITDPVLLVQNNVNLGGPGFTTVGPTTVGVSQSGAMLGGQIGCDYQFGSNLVLGIEGAASGLTLKGSKSVALPNSPPDMALLTVKTDFIPTLTGRVGFAVDQLLLYARAGVAWASSSYSLTGTFTGAGTIVPGIPFDFEGLSSRTGWTAGAGIEWAFTEDWSARLEYDYYDFGMLTATMNDTVNGSGPLSFKTTTQMVTLGLNFRVRGY